MKDKVLYLATTLWFGKFKGLTIKQLIDKEFWYIKWLMKEEFQFDDECYSYMTRRTGVIGLDTVLWFGRYRDKTLREAIDRDLKYIDWIKENLKGIKLSNECDKYILNKKIEISREYYRNNPIKL